MAKDSDAKNGITCGVALLGLLINLPLWYVLLFGVLSRVDAPAWMWACYWVYVPAGIAVHLVGGLAKIVVDE